MANCTLGEIWASQIRTNHAMRLGFGKAEKMGGTLGLKLFLEFKFQPSLYTNKSLVSLKLLPATSYLYYTSANSFHSLHVRLFMFCSSSSGTSLQVSAAPPAYERQSSQSEIIIHHFVSLTH
ncbi:hypothetical protein L596_020396 [Steinernema carpocapsae]|uniref:Uncharacterized protein n=1 Tax=Steinernema carpocapsae TaxID=34508 RepID=A0A4U5MU26_STECR|nr:hypothetical protein L596_020396 [Steinernema carpocapsae]